MDLFKTTPRLAVLISGLVVLFLSALPLEAQRLVGYVIDESNRSPIAGAQIVILDSDGRQQRSTVTDDDGWFLFAMAAPGTYTIGVSHIGYRSYASETIELGRGETVEIRVRLGATVIPLEPLEVTARSASMGRLAEFHQRLETRAFGRFLAREDIEARPVPRVTDLLRTQPGVRIESARRGPFERPLIAMRGGAGSCQPNLFIDGVRVRQSADFPIDDLIAPDMLEGVEIYTSTATAPAQYQTASQCGVVLFWTRQGEPGRPFSWKRLAAGIAAAGLVVLFFVK